MPKVDSWWVEPRLLISGNDPGETLAAALEQFPSETDPMVFMTGDGHRNPPFRWSNRGVWGGVFDDAVRADKICCHVETYADNVTVGSVPAHLAQVFYNHKVFGWEPDFYKAIESVLEAIGEMLPHLHLAEEPALSDVRHITREMWRVHGHGYLKAEGLRAMQYWDSACLAKRDPVPLTRLPNFRTFLTDYNRTAMALRVQINPIIGANIQKMIDKYPDHMHLITCGNAHIRQYPLYRYVKPPVGTMGIVDEDQDL